MAVEAAVGQHPKARNCRLTDKCDRIEVYERVGPDAAELVAGLPGLSLEMRGLVDRLRADMDRYAQFTPVLRFILADATERIFRVERMCYLSSVDGWLDVHQWGPVDRLARDWIPGLGTDRLFESYG